MHSPLTSTASFNEVIKAPEVGAGQQEQSVDGGKLGEPRKNGFIYDDTNKSLALMAQPSVDYGKFNFNLTFLPGSG